MTSQIETETEVTETARFSGWALLAAFVIALATILAGVVFLAELLPNERVGSRIDVDHEVRYGQDTLTVEEARIAEDTLNETTVRSARTDSESWVVAPGLVPVSTRAALYALLLVGSLLMAAGVTLSLASLTTKRTVTKTREGDAGLLQASETVAIPAEVIKETVAALATAKGPNLVVLAGTITFAMAFGLAWHSSTAAPKLPELTPVLAPVSAVETSATTSTTAVPPPPTTSAPPGSAD